MSRTDFQKKFQQAVVNEVSYLKKTSPSFNASISSKKSTSFNDSTISTTEELSGLEDSRKEYNFLKPIERTHNKSPAFDRLKKLKAQTLIKSKPSNNTTNPHSSKRKPSQKNFIYRVSIFFFLFASIFFSYALYKVYSTTEILEQQTSQECLELLSKAESRALNVSEISCQERTWQSIFGQSKAYQEREYLEQILNQNNN